MCNHLKTPALDYYFWKEVLVPLHASWEANTAFPGVLRTCCLHQIILRVGQRTKVCTHIFFLQPLRHHSLKAASNVNTTTK